MAHFAKINSDNEVEQIIVFDGEGVTGEKAVAKFMGGGTWKQTSFNATIRKNYAEVGGTYYESLDAFVPAFPMTSPWVLDEETCRWVRPEGFVEPVGSEVNE